MKRIPGCLSLYLLTVLLLPFYVQAQEQRIVRIGVLAYRGGDMALRMWEPTARYLSRRIPGHRFIIVPLDLAETGPAVANRHIDFLLTNTGNFVTLEARYRLSALATLRNRRRGRPYSRFGAVIFVRADRDDIRTLADLKGKTFMGVKRDGFGGFQMAWRELKHHGIDPFRDFRALRFSGFPQDAVAYAVRDGLVDAGTFRTDSLERMIAEGKIKQGVLKIINLRKVKGFPFALSTQLYPEWPFARLPHVSDQLARQVAVELLRLPPDSPAASAAMSFGWDTPLSYRPVHDLMREIRVGPYAGTEYFSLNEALQRYRLPLIAAGVLMLLLLIFGIYLMRVIRHEKQLRQQLEDEAIERINTEISLRKSQKELASILNNMQDTYYRVDMDGIVTHISRSAEKLLGYTMDEMLGSRMADYYVNQADRERFLKAMEENDMSVVDYQVRLRRKDGRIIWVSTNAQACYDDSGKIVGIEGTTRDISSIKLVEEALRKQKERALITLQSIGDGVITTNRYLRIHYINPVAEQLAGIDNNTARGRRVKEILCFMNAETREPMPDPVSQCSTTGELVNYSDNCIAVRNDGREYAVKLTAAPIRGDMGDIDGVVMVIHDVSEMWDMAQRLSFQANHDPLTGLINRREFERKLEKCLQSARNDNVPHALCYMDLDQFKIVNDSCGHVAGDQLLQQLATLLQGSIREGDTLARLGGDEFGLLLEHCSLDDAMKIAEKIRAEISEYRFSWEDRQFDTGVSIGLVPIHAHSGSMSDILGAADAACYVAKDLGRNRIHCYSPDDTELARHHTELEWVQRIKQCLKENKLCLYYQEIRPLNTEADGSHFEILLRMLDDDGDIVLPASFIPAAERYHLMPDIDRWVISNAFRQVEQYQKQGERLSITINLSGQSLGDQGFCDFVIESIDAHDIDTTRICFEITETAAVSNLTSANEFIHRMRETGCSFSLDDFGSGLSSFSYLKNLQVDYLKIDGSFIRDIIDDPVDHAMVVAINQVGHIMGVRTVAEFVENDIVLERLRMIGIDYVQGYAIGRPQPLVCKHEGAA